MKCFLPLEGDKPRLIASSFYALLRDEVAEGNPYLDPDDQKKLRDHYPVVLNLKKYSPGMAAMIYSSRRCHAVQAILDTEFPFVFDAGCGYGSESFLFAGLGAKVLAVDISAEQIRIARKRQYYYEELFNKHLDITFIAANLEEYTLEKTNVSLTWVASVLAAMRNQDKFLEMTYKATRPKGKIMITDMNLLNPLFLVKEWYRRQHAKNENVEFALQADFLAMVRRQDRIGARYFSGNNGRLFDDVQFFSAITLSKLLSNVGFTPGSVFSSGFIPPYLWQLGLDSLENVLSRVPLLRCFGYFYLVSGLKQ